MLNLDKPLLKLDLNLIGWVAIGLILGCYRKAILHNSNLDEVI